MIPLLLCPLNHALVHSVLPPGVVGVWNGRALPCVLWPGGGPGGLPGPQKYGLLGRSGDGVRLLSSLPRVFVGDSSSPLLRRWRFDVLLLFPFRSCRDLYFDGTSTAVYGLKMQPSLWGYSWRQPGALGCPLALL